MNLYLFVLNFSEAEKVVELGETVSRDLLTGETVRDTIILPRYGVRILERGQ